MALAAMVCTTLAVFAAGWAPDGPSLIVFTALIGLFSAAAVSPAVGQLGAVYSEPSKRRNRAFACFSAGNPLGFVVGTFVAGVVLEISGTTASREGAGNDSGWRVCFWVFCVLCAGFAGLVAFTVPSDVKIGTRPAAAGSQGVGVSGWEVLKRFDLLGALLVTAGVSLVSAGLTCVFYLPSFLSFL
jgi:MFS family permease